MTKESLDLTLQQFHLATESNLIKLSITKILHMYMCICVLVLIYLPRWSYMFPGYIQVTQFMDNGLHRLQPGSRR